MPHSHIDNACFPILTLNLNPLSFSCGCMCYMVFVRLSWKSLKSPKHSNLFLIFNKGLYCDAVGDIYSLKLDHCELILLQKNDK